ncbi:MAG: hypothetical protein KGL39_33730 [Patescibacteria group bacterium]|nr:hypothetical protein [Patescibacteria group bacterium]
MKPLTGQVAVSGTAQQIDPNQTASKCRAFTIYAPKGNSAGVFIGASGITSSTGHQLDPGQSFTYERRSDNAQPFYQLRPSDFWVVGTSPDKVSWLASP